MDQEGGQFVIEGHISKRSLLNCVGNTNGNITERQGVLQAGREREDIRTFGAIPKIGVQVDHFTFVDESHSDWAGNAEISSHVSVSSGEVLQVDINGRCVLEGTLAHE